MPLSDVEKIVWALKSNQETPTVVSDKWTAAMRATSDVLLFRIAREEVRLKLIQGEFANNEQALEIFLDVFDFEIAPSDGVVH
jgi:hypothetical protein